MAEQLVKINPASRIHFFCSKRAIDAQILSKAGHQFTPLPAEAFSLRPAAFVKFLKTFFQSAKIAREKISQSENAVIIGIGGFAAPPVCWAAHRKKLPVALINVDIVPGRANKLIARWADKIFVQFEQTLSYLKRFKKNIEVVGCPLRESFHNPNPQKAKEELGLDKNKKILLITGASSGSQNINNTVCSLMNFFDGFADTWQIVHLTGVNNFEQVKNNYSSAKIHHTIVAYYDNMPDLLSAADLLIGRSGAVSVAEYAAAAVPSICMPYPYHKDMHQYLNAGILVEAGAAIIVDDVPDETDRREWLVEELKYLMSDDSKRAEMKAGCKSVARKDAAAKIAQQLMKISI